MKKVLSVFIVTFIGVTFAHAKDGCGVIATDEKIHVIYIEGSYDRGSVKLHEEIEITRDNSKPVLYYRYPVATSSTWRIAEACRAQMDMALNTRDVQRVIQSTKTLR